MLLDAIATVILAGMMLVPLVNVIVGGVLGAGLAGPLGGVVGILLAIAVTALETWLADCLGLRDLRVEPATATAAVSEEQAPVAERTIKTGPPSPRRRSQSGRTAKALHAPAPSKTMQHGVAH